MRVEVLESEGEVARRAAGLVCAALAARPGCVLGLASGKTPVGMYEELARRDAVLSDATVFAIDELHGVPRSHPATNASYFRDRLPGPVRGLHLLDSEAT